jgi:hypothetical protein
LYHIKAAIIANGYSNIKEFADDAGIKYVSLWRKITGKSKWEKEDIEILCRKLNKSPHELFFQDWLLK